MGGSRWFGVVVDSLDPARLARWWAEVLGYRIVSEDPGEVVVGPASIGPGNDGHQPRLIFVRVTEAKTGKNRLHIDLAPDSQAEEVERLVDMGARHVDLLQADDVRWVVLADPEGNEFCVLEEKRATE
jgi:catechol 2,3-dioxygenase-like lactoylglutathione lyase family enzyme